MKNLKDYQIKEHAIKVMVLVVLALGIFVFSSQGACPTGDLNGDCIVDIDDLVMFAGQWLGDPAIAADLVGNDGVDIADYSVLAENWLAVGSPLIISEFMAVNSYVPFTNPTNIHTTVDGKQDNSDWIEIHNPDSQRSFSLDGLYLTDDAKNLNKWRFPDISIAPGGYLNIWASRKTIEDHPNNYPYFDDLGNLHTNFSLSQNGEYLALVETDGSTVISEFASEFPKQRGLISYGYGNNGVKGYLLNPTPGYGNSAAYMDVVADTGFSVDRGFFEADDAFDVIITTDTTGAVIRYTLDGSTPTLSNGNNYITSIHVDSTTCLRAAAFKTNWLPTGVDTQTYIFLDDVIAQSPNGEAPAGWPATSVNGQVFDYGMDPDIVQSGEYSLQMLEAMKQIPSVSLVTDLDNLVGSSNGIYVNAGQEGIMAERQTSVELINPDGSDGFQVNAGLRIRGAYSRSGSNPKHSFRLLFKGGYGPGELDFPIFGDEGVKKFDNIDLRTAQNYAWSNWGNDGSRNTLIRDVYSRDMQREMGRPYTRSRYYHLYLNGLYWGVYQSQERSEASYAASYFGGHDEYYDIIKTDNYSTSYTDGTLDKWNQLWYLCGAGLETDAKYYLLQGKDANGNDDPTKEVHVDVDNLIDYMLDIFFAGNQDAPITLGGDRANNFYAIRNRNPESRHGWQFFAYDSEHSMLSAGIDRTGWFSAGSQIGHFNPQWLHQEMMVHPEYQIHFADHAQKHLFNDGAMTTAKAKALCLKRASEIDMAIIGESARWGDQRSAGDPYTKAHWWNEVNGFLVNTYLSGRTQTVLNQLKSRNLYPQVQSPVFNKHGGNVATGFEIVLSASSGTIYYTLDGSDPRLPGGATNSSAQIYANGAATHTLIPTGTTWKYLDNGTDQGQLWTDVSYNDNLWASGPAQLGYGDGGEATTVSYGSSSSNKHITTYFRHTFNVDDPLSISILNGSLVRDDGAVVYLNGIEIYRDNMPDTAINYRTPASSVIGGHDESRFYEFSTIDTNLLVSGDNVIAVEIHQSSPTSTDMSFDFELTATVVNSISCLIADQSDHMMSRTLDGGNWSALNEVTFAVGPVAESLRITEIMYHPKGLPYGDPNSEFIELENIGTEMINLNLVKFVNGVDFTFSGVELAADEYVLVVENIVAFNSRYPGLSGSIVGEYAGSFNDGGEKIRLEDAVGTVIHEFSYKDGWYDITDGGGFSLTVIDPAAAASDMYADKDTWRASTMQGGSPGFDDIGPIPGQVVINEVLAHSDIWPNDWIELHNTTISEINIGGWYLSDNNDDDTSLMKYRIADGTTIASGGYMVFVQDEHFGNAAEPGCLIPFALSENGEKVCLTSSAGGALTGLRETEDFGASEVGIAFGRYYKASTNTYNFVLMSTSTQGNLTGPDPYYQGAANSTPKVGPIVISEIMYNPPFGGSYDNDEYEYVELYNMSGLPVTLQEYDAELKVTTPWNFTDGIDFIFPLNTTIAANARLVIARNLNAYAERYGSLAGVVGPFANDTKLSNSGERLQLAKPGDTDESGMRHYIRIDRVVYSDGSHPVGDDQWPVSADGNGKSLNRKSLTSYGNDIANWQAASPTP